MMMILGGIILSLLGGMTSALDLGGSTTMATTVTVTNSDSLDTCQCGVFLLGTQPLTFSSDAKPILSGMPVPANCSAREDKIQCSSICRQLIETMSQSNENSPLVQTVVLAATRTLACQRFNESEKVPLPRTIDAVASSSHQAKLDDSTNKWKFLVGPLSRSDVTAELEHMGGNHADGEEEDNFVGRLTQPKFLGGFYRWCDEHWIYAGVSLHEPLCCLQHLPKKCPSSSAKSARNGRKPRLIIRRCKTDCSSEEELKDDFPNELSAETPSTSTKTPSTSLPASKKDTSNEESDAPSGTDDNGVDTEANSQEDVDTINFIDSTSRPPKNRKPLNSTAVAEAFKFVSSLMNSIGYGEIVNGITSVLPASTAAELIDRVDMGGWVSNYQDRYMTWPREFSMGFCYMEYGMYNMASDGFAVTTNQLLNRVFKLQRSGTSAGSGNGGHMLPVQGPPPGPGPMNHHGEMMQGSAPPPQMYQHPGPLHPGPNPNNINNYISSIPENSFTGYGQPVPVIGPGLGNRRVKRAVTVSRSYSSATSTADESGNGNQSSGRPASTSTGGQVRRVVRRKLINNMQRARNAPSNSGMIGSVQSVPLTDDTTTTTSTTQSPLEVYFHNASRASSSFTPSSSFVPTSSQQQQQPQTQGIPFNPHYYQNNYYQYDIPQHQQPSNPQQYPQQSTQAQRSHHQDNEASGVGLSLTEFARPRRNGEYPHQQYGPPPSQQQQQQQVPPPAHYQQQVIQHRQGMPPPHPPQQQYQQPPPPANNKGKEGPSGGGAGSLLNLANILVQTAMSGNGGGGSGGSGGGGDAVSAIMNNAIPLVSQVASNPSIQNMVSGLVTSFLTPPQRPSPPPPPPSGSGSQRPKSTTPQPISDDEDSLDNNYDADEPSKGPGKDSLYSNEITEPEVTESKPSSSNNSPPPNNNNNNNNNGGSGMLQNMLTQMISTYIRNMISGGGSSSSSGGGGGSSGGGKPPNRIDLPSNKPQPPKEAKDVVEMITDVAKPFFISYFGVVPDVPGFGQLRLDRKKDRMSTSKEGAAGFSPNDILDKDPDPGTGISDVIFGSANNIPETGNGIIDFGNRVVYAFHYANDAQHGLYCFKQYTVNKLWDYFKMGVTAVFKK